MRQNVTNKLGIHGARHRGLGVRWLWDLTKVLLCPNSTVPAQTMAGSSCLQALLPGAVGPDASAAVPEALVLGGQC